MNPSYLRSTNGRGGLFSHGRRSGWGAGICGVALGTLLVSACSSSTTGGADAAGTAGPAGASGGLVAVTAGDTTCDVATAQLPSGRHTFEVTNNASQVNELYVYAAGDRIMGEVENIGPSTRRKLIVDLPAGDYQVTCKPGMVGDGIRSALTVTGTSAPQQSQTQELQAAVASYRGYVQIEARALQDTTRTFTNAVAAGDLDAARAAYATARLHYERIEPIAESFGDLDPLIDMRIDDAGPGTPFVGFHALEQLIFQKKTLTGAASLGTSLNQNVAKLNKLVQSVNITPLTMGNGAKSLLDEVAKSKVTGEEERYSRIDLVDFAGNVDGARYAYTALRPTLMAKKPALVATLDRRFTSLITLLGTHRATTSSRGYIVGSPYISYDALTPSDVKALATEVDAISEPLGQISGLVAGS